MNYRKLVEDALARVNRKRSLRILNFNGAVQAIREAIQCGHGLVGAETVAKSYDWKAIRTVVFAAVNSKKDIVVFVGTADAHRGKSMMPDQLPWFIKNRETSLVREWADHPSPNSGHVIISRRVALKWVRERDREIAVQRRQEEVEELSKLWAEQRLQKLLTNEETLKTTPITFADSINCGNCEPETSRIQKTYFPDRATVPASEVLQVIRAKEPHLIRFAIRAVSHVIREQVATA